MVRLREDDHRAVLVLREQITDIGIPAEPEIERKVARDLPVVLNIERELVDRLLVRCGPIRVGQRLKQVIAIEAAARDDLRRGLAECQAVAAGPEIEVTVK